MNRYRHLDGPAKRVLSIDVRELLDDDPDLSWLEQDYNEPSIPPAEAARYREQDSERLKDYGYTWNMVGIDAVAQVTIGGVIQTITSGGIWGVESDSEGDYLHEIGAEQLDALAEILLDMGFGASELAEHWPEGFDFTNDEC